MTLEECIQCKIIRMNYRWITSKSPISCTCLNWVENSDWRLIGRRHTILWGSHSSHLAAWHLHRRCLSASPGKAPLLSLGPETDRGRHTPARRAHSEWFPVNSDIKKKKNRLQIIVQQWQDSCWYVRTSAVRRRRLTNRALQVWNRKNYLIKAFFFQSFAKNFSDSCKSHHRFLPHGLSHEVFVFLGCWWHSWDRKKTVNYNV